MMGILDCFGLGLCWFFDLPLASQSSIQLDVALLPDVHDS